MTPDDRTPGEIITDRLADLVDLARELPRDGVLTIGLDTRREGWPWATAGRRVADPRGWPDDLPLPLTVGDALDVVEEAREDIADDLTDEIWRVVEALVPTDLADDVAEAVAAEWPWPDALDTARDRALDALARGVLGPSYRPLYIGQEEAIAEWAAARLEATIPEYAAELRANASTLGGMLTGWRDDAGRWPAAGLVLVWHAEAAARCRAYALDAAADARAHLAHLVDARDAGQEIIDARDLATLGDPLADVDPSTRGRWAGDVLAVAQGVARSVLALPEPTTEDDARAAAAAAAGVLADALAKQGPAGREKAAAVRLEAAERAARVVAGDLRAGELWWSSWGGTSPPAPWIADLARVLWADVWRPERERERDRPRELTPALPVDVHTAIARGLSVWTVEPREDGADVLWSRDKVRLADLAPAGLPDALRPDALTAAELRSVDTHRFLLWFLRTLREREVADEYDWRVIRVDGRWARLAELVDGGHSRSNLSNLSKIVPYLARLPIPGPPGTEPGNLYTFDPGARSVGQRQGWFALTAGTLLHPGALHARHRWDRATIPVPDLPPMARVVSSRANEHGQIATLRLYTVRRLQSAGAELLTEGGAKIHGSAWLEDLAAVGLREPIARWDRVVDAWLTGGDDAGPFLVRAGRDRYHLHPDHKGARDYLDEGARRSKEGAERAQRGLSAKNKRGSKRGK